MDEIVKLLIFISFGTLIQAAPPGIAEDIWQTIYDGKVLKNECPRTASISGVRRWPEESSTIYGIDSNQKTQLAYNVFSNRFGSGYYNNGKLCAFFENSQTCDAFRILAVQFPGARQYNCIPYGSMNTTQVTPIQYRGVYAIYSKEYSLVGNYGPICEGNEDCALFYNIKGDPVSFKGNSAINQSVCFIVREH